ncbi:hypothetical protein FRB99_004232 [Tulasnella sp. 403]|nr:hypothetical protein FRB99_004232 [Tulasnella sp. 403]
MDYTPVTASYFTRRTPLVPVSSADIYAQASPYFALPSWFRAYYPATNPTYLTEESNRRLQEEYERQRALQNPPPPVPGGTILHKGFYDLLALSTPVVETVSRIWNGTPKNETLVAGAPYHQLPTGPQPQAVQSMPPNPPVVPTHTPVKKGRRISKDMIGNPTQFRHLVHASDAEQAEALLTRWGPDRVGKLGDPRWALPIKNFARQRAQERAVAQVVANLKPTASQIAANLSSVADNGLTYPIAPGPLRVVNGISTPSSLTVSTGPPSASALRIDGLPSPRGPAWPAGTSPTAPPFFSRPITERPETEPLDAPDGVDLNRATTVKAVPISEPPLVPPKPRPINPSLSTLEKAASARIFFENLYFPLLRHPASREQRRQALEREMNQLGMKDDSRTRIRDIWQQNETEYLRDRRRKVDVSAFKQLKVIGHGAFGVVSLVKEKSTGQLFAMKQLRKTDMLRKGQEGHVRAERDVLKTAALVTSPNAPEWIVRMHYSFQDTDNLYLVLEYMGGGDLLNLLIEKDVFEENFARFYIAEMVLAVESCHKHGFIHRDIKPDNFLFDPNGHIRLSDFGLATDLHWAHDTSYYEQQRKDLLRKYGIDLDDSNGLADGRKTKKMDRKEVERIMGGGDGEVGIFTWREKHRKKLAYSVYVLGVAQTRTCHPKSFEASARRGHGYTFSCDWWSLGVIMFECLYGYPPFVSSSRHVTRQKILNWKQTLKFPPRPRVSHEGINLIEQLLCEPEDRIGSQSSASVTRPNSLITQARRSGFVYPNVSHGQSVDGAEYIKAHPWFRGIDWLNIHKQAAPFKPNLRNPEDTRHFDDDIPPEPLAPANGAPPDATRDPLLKDKVHGDHILNVRKALAFAGFTHRSPRKMDYLRADMLNYAAEDANHGRGRDTQRRGGNSTLGRGRALSL